MIYLNKYKLAFDEVGRGCIAGPLVVGAVVIDPYDCGFLKDLDIKDSKKISKSQNPDPVKARDKLNFLAANIKKFSKDYGLGIATSQEIDELGLSVATQLAYKRSRDCITATINEYCIDGSESFIIDGICQIFYKNGDQKIFQIACASIIAKSYRDQIMIDLAQKFDKYGFENNVGYGTKEHLMAISQHGIIENHRKSTKPIKGYQNGRLNK